IRLSVAVSAFRGADDFWFSIAGKIGKRRRLIIGYIEDDMLFPVSVAALGIFIPGRLFAWKADDQDIVPAVFIEIVSEREEIIGILIFGSKRAFKAFDALFRPVRFFANESLSCRINLVTLLKSGPFIPIWSRHDVRFAVVIEIAKRRAFGPELVRELDFFEAVRRIGRERRGNHNG